MPPTRAHLIFHDSPLESRYKLKDTDTSFVSQLLMTLEPAFIARLQLAKSAASCGQDGMPGLIYLPSILLRWKHSPCPRRLTEPEALQ